MDAERFDRITRILAIAPSRRTFLGVVLGGVAGLTGRAETNAKRRKKKKKKCGACGECRTCVNGACKAKDDGTECGDGDICQGGVCGCDPGFEPCGNACVQSCVSGQVLNANCQCVCNNQSCAGCCDDATCLPIGGSQSDQQCGSGGNACAACGTNEECAQGSCDCLSGFERCDGDCVPRCTGDQILNEECECACPPNREECGDVCCAAGKICVDPDTGSCVTGQGNCQEGADTCLTTPGNPLVTCNARVDCFCFQSMSGDTRCGQFIPPANQCGECEDDEDCEETYGPGTFCVAGSQPACCVTGGNICVAPCSTDPPSP